MSVDHISFYSVLGNLLTNYGCTKLVFFKIPFTGNYMVMCMGMLIVDGDDGDENGR